MKAWHNRDGTPGEATEKTWFRFQEVWTKNIATCDDATSTIAGQHGYGMNINQVSDGTGDDSSFDTSITNFSQAHQHTQATINSLSTQNQALQTQHANQMSQMQQQMNSIQQQLIMAVNSRPMMPTMQAPAYQAPAYNNQRNNNNNNRNNNNGGGNGGGGNGYNNQNRAPPNPVKRFENFNYCFSHGFDVADDHCSMNCPKPGHVKTLSPICHLEIVLFRPFYIPLNALYVECHSLFCLLFHILM